jgi:hypothetical protein
MAEININIPVNDAILIRKVLAISLKAHRNNPSPVDIKTELAALPARELEQLHDDLESLLNILP